MQCEKGDNQNVFKATCEAVIFQVLEVQHWALKFTADECKELWEVCCRISLCLHLSFRFRCAKTHAVIRQQPENYGTILEIINLNQSLTKNVEFWRKRVCSLRWASEHESPSFGNDPMGKPAGTSVRMGESHRRGSQTQNFEWAGPSVPDILNRLYKWLFSLGICIILIKNSIQPCLPEP